MNRYSLHIPTQKLAWPRLQVTQYQIRKYVNVRSQQQTKNRSPESFNNNRIAREEPGPRGIWGRVQGVGLVQGVTRSGLVCDSPSARSADAREARSLVELWVINESYWDISIDMWEFCKIERWSRVCSIDFEMFDLHHLPGYPMFHDQGFAIFVFFA